MIGRDRVRFGVEVEEFGDEVKEKNDRATLHELRELINVLLASKSLLQN